MTSTDKVPKTTDRFPAWLLAVLLGFVTAALYWPATRHDFVNYDDETYVTSNVHVQNGLTLENLKWAFLNPVSSNWHPLTLLSHMLDCQLFGLKPWGHHLTSVLLHALNTLLIFLLLRSLTGAVWRSVAAAALFGLHPLHVESVAWVAERKDVLSACFGLLTLIFYTRYARAKNRQSAAGNYLLTLVCMALGLMSKAMLVTWPFVLLLLDYWPLARFQPGRKWRLVAEKIPFFALAVADSVVTFVVQKQGGGLIAVERLSLGARNGNALVSYCRYLGKLFWPTNLAVFYPYSGSWPPEKVLLAGGLLLGISALVFVQRRRRFLLMGWLWFIGTLVPVIGLVQVGGQAMADRYTYLPSLGVFIIVIWGGYELTLRWHYRVIALSLASAAAILLCFILTGQQIRYWQDSETLFRHALVITENNSVAHNNLGIVLQEQGRFGEAISQYQAALRLNPGDAKAHHNLGITLYEMDRTDEAISQFQEVVRLTPNDAQAHYNLGKACFDNGQIDGAISQFREVVRLTPNDPEARYNLGGALARQGRNDEAIPQLQEALRLKPDFTAARNILADLLQMKNAPAGR